MDWWHKLKDKIFPTREGTAADPRSSARRAPRLPSVIFALCSTGADEAFAVEITSLSVSGMKLTAKHVIAPHAVLNLKVPVGANFENRDTTEYISFTVQVMWVHKKQGTRSWEAGVRFNDEAHVKRDRWIRLVMDNYGLSTEDDRDERRRHATRHRVHLPVAIAPMKGGESHEGQILNLSTGGLLMTIEADGFEDGQKIYVEIGPVAGAAKLSAMATIVHAHFERSVEAWYLGVRFDLLSDEQKKLLVACVSSLGTPLEEEAPNAG